MTIERQDFQDRLRDLLGLRGAALTTEELSRMLQQYPRCRGKEPWSVRQYVGRAGVGAREYRVLRGGGIEDVYRSTERERADAVGTALNELEFEDRGREARGGGGF